ARTARAENPGPEGEARPGRVSPRAALSEVRGQKTEDRGQREVVCGSVLCPLSSDCGEGAMQEPAGRIIPISLPRRLVGDLLHFARQVPTIPVQRRMRLERLLRARRDMPRPVRRSAVFTK